MRVNTNGLHGGNGSSSTHTKETLPVSETTLQQSLKEVDVGTDGAVGNRIPELTEVAARRPSHSPRAE